MEPCIYMKIEVKSFLTVSEEYQQRKKSPKADENVDGQKIICHNSCGSEVGLSD
jgi:hypothetical protein